MNKKLAKATVIDGVAATEDRDSQNEILHLSGADIDEMTTKGYFNDNHGNGFINTLGRITYAKKILKQDDAQDSREKRYWDRMQRPFLYVKGYLFDEGDHPNAKAVSAIMKEFRKMGTPLDVQMSVEGKKIDVDPREGRIKRSMIRNVALTLVPANDSTSSEIVSENARQAILTKCKEIGANVDYASNLIKGMSTQKDSMSMRKGFIEIVDTPKPISSLDRISDKVKSVSKMVKMLAAGYGSASKPSARTGGSTLMEESNKSKKLFSTTFAFDKKTKKDIMKSLLKKVREQYPHLSQGDAVEYTLQILREKFKTTKGE